MDTQKRLKDSAEALGLKFTDDQFKELAEGKVVSIPSVKGMAAAECCPEGFVGIGHNPRWCVRLNPPGFSICWG